MLTGRVLVGLSVLLVAACGSGVPSAGDGDGGDGGNPPQTNSGGTGGDQPSIPEEGTGQSDQGANENQRATGTSGSGGLGAIQEACPDWTQNPVTLDAVIGGANATGSATEAREALSAEPPESPIPAHVRTQDFLSYYRPAFAEPAGASPEVHIQLRPSTVSAQYDLLVAIRAPKAASHPKTSLTIVVDNTSSMTSSGLAKAKDALLTIKSELEPGDTVQWITAAPDAMPRSFDIATSALALEDAIKQLDTEMEEQTVTELLETAYEQARASYVAGGYNRVLFVSDGADNPAMLPSVISASAAPGPSGDIRLTALGTGPARTNGHRLLRSASRFGRGVYRYLDTSDEALKLAGRFDELFGVALDDVKLNLTVPWYFTVLRPFVGDQATTDGTVEPQYVAPGGSMTFLYRLEACAETAAAYYGLTIDADFSWISPADGSTQHSPRSASVSELLTAPDALELKTLFAVTSYAEALRSLDKRRLEAALLQVGAAGLTEIKTLLERHPVFALP